MKFLVPVLVSLVVGSLFSWAFLTANEFSLEYLIYLSMIIGAVLISISAWRNRNKWNHSFFEDFIQGIQLDFKVFHVIYAYIKTTLFAFILATIPSYHGFFMKGGALEVGKASNISFVWTSIVIIIINFVVTQLLLA